MDKELDLFTINLASYHPQALEDWKKTLWSNTDHWDKLLADRAEITGRLVLSEFTKTALSKFKK